MNTKITIPFSLTALLFAIICFSCKKQQQGAVPEPAVSAYVINFIPARTGNELTTLRKDPKANLIRTFNDFDAIVISGSTPLSRLSAAQVSALRSSLLIREGIGVVSFSYWELKSNLSYDDFAAVMNMFGLDIKGGYWGLSQDPAIIAKLSVAEEDDSIDGDEEGVPNSDHTGYFCSPDIEHTCKKYVDCICLSGC